MRASRLLHMLLILQNRGKQTARQLASELEVSTRTILRDVEALQEAGLPMVVHQGNRGGIELGFGYRTRLTGLTRGEAEALGVVVASQIPLVKTLGIEQDTRRALSKIMESLPDSVRSIAIDSQRRFTLEEESETPDDYAEVIEALTNAVKGLNIVTVQLADGDVRKIHPSGLVQSTEGWLLADAIDADSPVRIADLVSINISAHVY